MEYQEATTGFEPVIRVLQTLALPLGHVAKTKLADGKWLADHPAICHQPVSKYQSGQRDSNS
jgi:hypothetical protein